MIFSLKLMISEFLFDRISLKFSFFPSNFLGSYLVSTSDEISFRSGGLWTLLQVFILRSLLTWFPGILKELKFFDCSILWVDISSFSILTLWFSLQLSSTIKVNYHWWGSILINFFHWGTTCLFVQFLISSKLLDFLWIC